MRCVALYYVTLLCYVTLRHVKLRQVVKLYYIILYYILNIYRGITQEGAVTTKTWSVHLSLYYQFLSNIIRICLSRGCDVTTGFESFYIQLTLEIAEQGDPLGCRIENFEVTLVVLLYLQNAY